jgi:hypothetical protein
MFATVLGSISVALAGAATVLTAANLATKLRARIDLSEAVGRAGEDERNRLRQMLDANESDAVAAMIRGHLADLPAAERREAEAALSQPSPAGRDSYARGVAARGLRAHQPSQSGAMVGRP